MKIIYALCFICFCFSQQNYSDSLNPILAHKLKQLEQQYILTLGFEERREAIKLMDEIILLIKSHPTDPNKKVVHTQSYQTFTDENFSLLLKQLEDASAFKKVDLFISSIKFGRISSEQLALAIKQVSFSDEQLKIFKQAFPYVYDKLNIQIAVNELSFSVRDNAITFLSKQ